MTENPNKKEELISLILVFIFFLVFYFGIKYLWGIYDLPSQQNIIDSAQGLFSKYGIVAILIAAFLEGLILIGNYFPGSMVIFLGLSLTFGDVNLAIKTCLAILIGLGTGYHVNYFLGKHGLYKFVEKFGLKDSVQGLKTRIEKKGYYVVPFIFVGTFGHLMSLVLGIMRLPYYHFLFLMLLSTSLYVFFWGTISFFYGIEIFKLLTSTYAPIVLAATYLIYLYRSGKLSELNDK